MEASKEYADQCLGVLSVGMRIFPHAGVPTSSKPASHPAEVVSVDMDRSVVMVSSRAGGLRLISGHSISTRWDWVGKPAKPSPVAPVIAERPKTGRIDHLSPMWHAIKNLQAEVAKLKADLGQS